METNLPLIKTKQVDPVVAKKKVETLGDIVAVERTRNFSTR